MGTQIYIECKRCSFDLTEMVGVGFAGIKYFICVCDDCKVFANRKHNQFRNGAVRPNFRCGVCRKPLRIVAPVDNDHEDTHGALVPCPICGGQLIASETSVMWD